MDKTPQSPDFLKCQKSVRHIHHLPYLITDLVLVRSNIGTCRADNTAKNITKTNTGEKFNG